MKGGSTNYPKGDIIIHFKKWGNNEKITKAWHHI